MLKKIFGWFNDAIQDRTDSPAKSEEHTESSDDAFLQVKEASQRMKAREAEFSQLGSLSFHETSHKLKEIVQRQYNDAEDKMENSEYWGFTGFLVKIAARGCEKSIEICMDEGKQIVNFDNILETLLYAKEIFDIQYSDEQGYGAGTFNEVIKDVMLLQKSQQENTRYTLENLHQIQYIHSGASLGEYLSLAIEPDEFLTAISTQDLQTCFSICQRVVEGSQIQDNIRLFRRLMMLVLTRLGDFHEAEKLAVVNSSESQNDDFENYLDQLIVGKINITEIDSEKLYPLAKARALYWYGAYKKSIGEEDWKSLLIECAQFKFFQLECVLAQVEAGIPWEPANVEKNTSPS